MSIVFETRHLRHRIKLRFYSDLCNINHMYERQVPGFNIDIYMYLRVQNEQFSEEKGFILRYTEKEV